MAKEQNIMKSIKKLALAAAAVVSLGLSSTSFGAQLLSFAAEPIQDLPEAQYNIAIPGQLIEDVGAIGNGLLNVAPGLSVEVPFILAGPGAVPGISTTTFQDVSLTLIGLAAAGNAGTLTMGGQTLVAQALVTGTFKLTATDNLTVLLAGTIENAAINGVLGAHTGAVLSPKVTYQSGIVYDELVKVGWKKVGDLSWSLLEISPALSTTGGGAPQLSAFKSNMMGQFSTPIPEPASLGLLALAGLGLAARRRTR